MLFRMMESGGDLVLGNVPLTWNNFMDRMRHPSAADFVKSIRRHSFVFVLVFVIFNVGRLSCLILSFMLLQFLRIFHK